MGALEEYIEMATGEEELSNIHKDMIPILGGYKWMLIVSRAVVGYCKNIWWSYLRTS